MLGYIYDDGVLQMGIPLIKHTSQLTLEGSHLDQRQERLTRMSTAQGFIRGVAGGHRFIASFVIDDIQYAFSGMLNPAVAEFTSREATLTYDSVEQLTSQRNFEGQVGSETVTLTIDNGPRISGPLEPPIYPASAVSGSGMWTQN
ncbi:hypothetical protein VTK73DRAFT_3936 [Phialemonium thermophilum]|uniref:Uncharacterized protein n=1 Tax=Phialemonium thermophilum TaxID=223376 RepID=A0ABR3VCX0_9PEZI